jgi:hypothetical protein
MRYRRLAPWMPSLLVVLLASECRFIAGWGACGSFLVIRVSASDSQRYSRIADPVVSATRLDRPAYAPTISRAASDSTVTEIRGDGGTYDVTVAKAGYTSVTRRVDVPFRGTCVAPGAVDLDVQMIPVAVR